MQKARKSPWRSVRLHVQSHTSVWHEASGLHSCESQRWKPQVKYSVSSKGLLCIFGPAASSPFHFSLLSLFLQSRAALLNSRPLFPSCVVCSLHCINRFLILGCGLKRWQEKKSHWQHKGVARHMGGKATRNLTFHFSSSTSSSFLFLPLLSSSPASLSLFLSLALSSFNFTQAELKYKFAERSRENRCGQIEQHQRKSCVPDQ